MSWIAEMFQQGGPAMLEVAYLSTPALVFALVYAVWPRTRAAWISAGIVALALLMAVGGWHSSRARTDDFIERERADPESRNTPQLDELRDRGYLEARRPLQLAAIVVAVCAVPLAIGEIRRRRRPR